MASKAVMPALNLTMMQKMEADIETSRSVKFNVIAWKSQTNLAKQICKMYPQLFRYLPTSWGKFSDSRMDHIVQSGYTPVNVVRRSHILFLAAFDDNGSFLSQLNLLVMLCESFISSLTIYMPYYPVGTMERVLKEGVVATANTAARLLSNLPRSGQGPARVMFYDLHTLQNRFYLHTNAIATLHTAIPAFINSVLLKTPGITAIAFPDEGAQKRFGTMFTCVKLPQIVCSKKRVGEKRHVYIHDGDPSGHHVVIVDDLIRSGGTLVSCAQEVIKAGAAKVSAFCTHAAFPLDDDSAVIKRFLKGGDRSVFDKIYLTNSNPIITDKLPKDDCFVILDLASTVVTDLMNG